ncbi:MAG: looped-hinge helix DNA binding domain, AbrB family [uncultured Acidilobus sp. JCHS]|nr:MAG: looped-hinge helix DNA binding domain, AbrB family [uncultured Acidilobus sp. JCHS]MDT7867469.1 AbrB/MazE/SpoVT family DNA-binding domain-containing protein [Acidianus sp.]
MSEAGTVRKVQRLGGSSLIITLPKQWAKKLGIKVGDEIQVVEDGGRLLIVPRDPYAEERASTVTIRYNGAARSAGTSTILGCAFAHGYSRVEILVKGLQEPDVRRLEAELSADPRVASVERGFDRLIVRLLETPESDPSKLLREAMGVMLDMVDAAVRGEEADVRRLESTASELMESAIRASRRSEGLDPLAQGVLASLPHVVADAALLLRSRPEELDMVKGALSELLGGLAGGSGRRALTAATIAAELRERAMAEGASMGALVVLADLIMNVALKAVCPSLMEDQD